MILGRGEAGEGEVSVPTLQYRVQWLMLVVPTVFGLMLEEALAKVAELAQVLKFSHVLGNPDKAARRYAAHRSTKMMSAAIDLSH